MALFLGSKYDPGHCFIVTQELRVAADTKFSFKLVKVNIVSWWHLAYTQHITALPFIISAESYSQIRLMLASLTRRSGLISLCSTVSPSCFVCTFKPAVEYRDTGCSVHCYRDGWSSPGLTQHRNQWLGLQRVTLGDLGGGCYNKGLGKSKEAQENW